MATLPAAVTLPTRYEDAHLTVDFRTGEVRLDGHLTRVTRREFELLSVLVQHAGQRLERSALLTTVWGYNADVRTRTLDVHIRRLRMRLGTYGRQHIETIHGVGYCFQPRHAPVRLEIAPPVRPLTPVWAGMRPR